MPRFASAVGLLAASLAALPSLDWCPLAARASATGESSAIEAASCAPARGCGPTAGACASETAAGEPDAMSLPPLAPPCDREPDPIPFGDNVWCIRPPVTAVATRPGELPEPGPSVPLAEFERPLRLLRPAPLAHERHGPEPGPPTRRAPHAPPQPRAPPLG